MAGALGHLACAEASEPALLPLRAHTLPPCDLPKALTSSELQLSALGDFAPTNDSAEVVSLDARDKALRFPAETQAVEARLEDGQDRFSGYGERRGQGIDVLLWPEQVTCDVARANGTQGYPGRQGGQALAYSAETGKVVAAGGNDPLVSDAIVGALAFDVATGAVEVLDTSDASVLQQPRAFATATSFGDQVLIAGGEEPVFGIAEEDIEPVASAEIFDPKRGVFVGSPLPLRSRRTHHAAVTLLDGRTVLVGGRGKVGTSSFAQYQLEIVDPATLTTSVGIAVAPRIEPRALRLSDGRVFIGGGVDAAGLPARPVGEWLSPSARADSTELSAVVEPRFDRAFVATAGGGVLAVGGCEDRRAASPEDAQACAAHCRRGCPPLAGYDAWWIDRDGNATPVGFDGIHAPRPILLPGSDGQPWLVAQTLDEPEIPRLFRFEPWSERFELSRVPGLPVLPRPDMPAPVAIDPDAFVWLDAGRLRGLRLGTRNRFSRDLALVLLSDGEEIRPQHMAPEAPTGTALSYDGTLWLRGAAARREQDPSDTSPDVSVRVTDTDYADVTIRLKVTDALPIVLLGDVALGGEACPWPDGGRRGGELDVPRVTRRGTRAELQFRGEARTCEVPSGRLALALRAGSGISRVRELDVLRGDER